MAQYFFDAEDYPVGTKLSEIGWVIDEANSNADALDAPEPAVIQMADGKKGFNFTINNSGYKFIGLPSGEAVTDVIALAMQNNPTSSFNASSRGVIKATFKSASGANYRASEDYKSIFESAINLYRNNTLIVNETISSTMYGSGRYMATRLSLVGGIGVMTRPNQDIESFRSLGNEAFSVRIPLMTGDEGAAGEPGFSIVIASAPSISIARLCIGTDGDTSSIFRPTPLIEVTAPHSLSVSDVTEVSATLNWL